ncbi:hypothetical protein V6Z12_A05G098000 [Gossypium hirsutum]
MGEKMTLMETIQWMLLEGIGGKVRFIIRAYISHAPEILQGIHKAKQSQ